MNLDITKIHITSVFKNLAQRYEKNNPVHKPCKDLHSLGFWVIFVENVLAMSDLEKIQLFEDKKVRTAWDEEKQEWFFSIVDVCGILTESKDYNTARKYWNKLKERLIAEGNELVTNCLQLKMVSPKDGKKYNTDVADMQGMLRIIQSIPSKKAEPIKVWIAQVAAERIGHSVVSPEKAIDYIKSPEEIPFPDEQKGKEQ